MLRFLVRKRSTGQALTEVALVLPLFFAVVFGVIDIGRVIWANDAVASAAREGARFASVHAGTVTLTTEASKDEIREHAEGFVIAGGVDTVVTVCFSTVQIASQVQGCSGDDDQANAHYERGSLVTVNVETRVPMIVGAMIGLGDFTVSGESTVLINN
jgi:Flp pilus assembly protein TadG